MGNFTIKIDGVSYRVRGKAGTLEESFRVEEGINSGTLLNGEHLRDVVGTYYDHRISIEPDPRYYQDYINLYEAISAPVESHLVEMPHEDSTIRYEAMITGGSHVIRDAINGRKRYEGLEIEFRAKKPQRRPT